MIFVLTFIFFSLFSSLSEAFDTGSTSHIETNLLEHCGSGEASSNETNDHSEEHKSCHDSNCYGTAHFGHGFYCSPLQFLVNEIIPISNKHLNSFYTKDRVYLVHLDSPFRPPLKA